VRRSRGRVRSGPPCKKLDADQILAFRLARSGLASRDASGLAEAAACPASDFSRDAALLALAARADRFTRQDYDDAVDGGDLVVAYAIRGAIHALAPGDHALYGRALIAKDDAELAEQLGEQVKRFVAEGRFAPGEALDEVAAATKDALARGRALDKNELHEELRERVRDELKPWCQGCGSYHVAPMLWRYGTVKAGVRLDSGRRYTIGKPGREPAASEAVRRFLGFYGPAKPADFADWAGLAKPHAQRLWDEVAGDLTEVQVGKSNGWLVKEDMTALDSPPAAEGHPPDPAGRPLPAATQPPAADPRQGAAQAAVPPDSEPRSRARPRTPGRPVEGEGEGQEG
jgi:hypothetical protein